MNVKLIGLTMPAEHFAQETQCEDANDLIAYCARVSNPSNQSNFDTADKLLKYCIRKNHWSVFEMADVILEIKCTRDIGRQILRHRSFNFQEFSQRYASPKAEDFEIRECRFQDLKNRQSSIGVDPNNQEQVSTALWWNKIQNEHIERSMQIYDEAINRGMAKELARAILPEGNTPSVMYMKGSVRSWFHYSLVRMDPGTQKEHRVIAQKAFMILGNNFSFVKEIEVK